MAKILRQGGKISGQGGKIMAKILHLASFTQDLDQYKSWALDQEYCITTIIMKFVLIEMISLIPLLYCYLQSYIQLSC